MILAGRVAGVAVVTAILTIVGGDAPTASGSPPGSVPVGAREVFRGDYSTGDLSQWATVQKRGINSATLEFRGDSGVGVVNGGRGHRSAARFIVRDGDIPPFGGGERAEVRAGDAADVEEGDERWYEFSLKFAADFPDPTGDWFIVMQWHAGSGPPPLCLEVNADGVLQVANNTGDAPRRDIGPIVRGRWVDYVLHAKFSEDPDIGFVEVHQDGVLVTPKHHRATMSSGSSYLKQGIYRDPDDSSVAVVWHDGLRITAP